MSTTRKPTQSTASPDQPSPTRRAPRLGDLKPKVNTTVRKGESARQAAKDLSSQAISDAKAMGLLPHEWLLKLMHGEPVRHHQWKVVYDELGNEKRRELQEVMVYADFATRVEAAKAAAPFFAPRLATQHVVVDDKPLHALIDTFRQLGAVLPV